MIIKRYKEIPLTKEVIEKYKSNNNLLKHLRIGKNVSGVVFISGSLKLIGYCAWDIHRNYIIGLEVASEFREKGFGNELVKKALEAGCRKLSVNKNNTKAIKLYESLGFKKNNTNLGPKMIEMER